MTEPRTAYDAWHDALEVNVAADEPWHQLVRDHLDPDRDLAGRTVLEIGCGRGGFACRLAAADARPAVVVATDFSRGAVTKGATFASKHGIDRAVWSVGDIQQLAHRNAVFDTVISCETVEHVPDAGRAVREIARVLRPRGRLFLTTPNYVGPMGLFRAYRRVTGRPFTEEGQPINTFTTIVRTLRWIRRAGLEPQTVDGTGHYLPLPGGPPRRIAALDRGRGITRWLALHSLVVAVKP